MLIGDTIAIEWAGLGVAEMTGTEMHENTQLYIKSYKKVLIIQRIINNNYKINVHKHNDNI